MKTKTVFTKKVSIWKLFGYLFSGNGGFLKLLTTYCRKKESFLLETSQKSK